MSTTEHNLTTRYFVVDARSPRRAELPGLGVVPAREVLRVEHFGPRTGTTRLGIAHREVTA
jgi:hypothetical protein